MVRERERGVARERAKRKIRGVKGGRESEWREDGGESEEGKGRREGWRERGRKEC